MDAGGRKRMGAAILQYIIPVIALPVGRMNPERNLPAARQPGGASDNL